MIGSFGGEGSEFFCCLEEWNRRMKMKAKILKTNGCTTRVLLLHLALKIAGSVTFSSPCHRQVYILLGKKPKSLQCLWVD